MSFFFSRGRVVYTRDDAPVEAHYWEKCIPPPDQQDSRGAFTGLGARLCTLRSSRLRKLIHHAHRRIYPARGSHQNTPPEFNVVHDSAKRRPIRLTYTGLHRGGWQPLYHDTPDQIASFRKVEGRESKPPEHLSLKKQGSQREKREKKQCAYA